MMPSPPGLERFVMAEKLVRPFSSMTAISPSGSAPRRPSAAIAPRHGPEPACPIQAAAVAAHRATAGHDQGAVAVVLDLMDPSGRRRHVVDESVSESAESRLRPVGIHRVPDLVPTHLHHLMFNPSDREHPLSYRSVPVLYSYGQDVRRKLLNSGFAALKAFLRA